MPRRKKTPAGGTAGVGAAGQVAAVNGSGFDSTPHGGRCQPPRAVGLHLDLSRQIDCCLFLVENTQDPVVRSFGKIALRRLESSIPTESRQ